MRWTILFLAFFINSFATVRILTFHYNQPDFVELQYKALKKFLKDDFELIVFNDARTLENEEAIETMCQNYGIKCVRFKPEWHLTDPLNHYLKSLLEDPMTKPNWHWNASTSIETIANNPSIRHCHAIQYALDHYGYDHDDIVAIMDGDCFLIKPLSIRELLGSNDIVGFNQGNDPLGKGRREGQITAPKENESLWVVFIAFRPSALPNPREFQFHVDVICGRPHIPNYSMGDTGSAIHRYLQKYPDLKVQAYHWQDSGIFRAYFDLTELKMMGFSDRLIQFIYDIAPGNVQFFVFESFMHFSAVSAEVAYHDQKAFHLRNFINDIAIP